MACKVVRRLALLHQAKGLCHKQDVQPDHFQPRSSLQLLAALEEHVTSSGKELLAGLKDLLFMEKEMSRREVAAEKEITTLLRRMSVRDQVDLLKLQGLNDTRGLFEKMQEVLAANAGVTNKKGSGLWEAILMVNPSLGLCIEKCTKIAATEVVKQAIHCYAIYSLLSQHVQAGKELAELQAAQGKILIHRGPMSPEQVQIFLCIGQAASFDISEDPSTRPC